MTPTTDTRPLSERMRPFTHPLSVELAQKVEAQDARLAGLESLMASTHEGIGVEKARVGVVETNVQRLGEVVLAQSSEIEAQRKRVEALESRNAPDDDAQHREGALQNQLETAHRLLAKVRKERDDLSRKLATARAENQCHLADQLHEILNAAEVPTHHPKVEGAQAAKPMMPQERVGWLIESLAIARGDKMVAENALATARQEGAEAERKRITEALRKCEWVDLVMLRQGEIPARVTKEGGDK